MFPKEHGAYGQMSMPLVTALAAEGASGASALCALTIVAAFFAHEPALVLAGRRGPRARRDDGARAARWLLAWGVVATLSASALWWLTPPALQWGLIVPAVPAAVVGALAFAGREKSATGEIAVALAFSLAALPMAMLAGATARSALAIALPFAAIFVVATVAVRVVILRVRGGGDLRAAARARAAVLFLSAALILAFARAAGIGQLPWTVLLASTPGLILAAAVALRPPHPSTLKAVGWQLVAVSVFAAVVIVIGARGLVRA